MARHKGITILELFEQVEALRVLNKVSIGKTAAMVGVTRLTYLNWKNKKTTPRGEREPDFRAAIEYLTDLYGRHQKRT